MSEVLDLPAITTVPLGELLTDIRNGLVVEQEKELPGIPITRIETISKGTVDMGRVRYVRDTAGKSLDNFWLKKGDILFSHINSDLHLGKTALVLSDAPLLHGMNLLKLRVDSSRLRPKYLHHWLDYCRRTGVFMAIAQHAVNQSSLNQKKIISLEVPLRSVAEQDEIVTELEKQFSRLDEAVANLQRVKANLKRYKVSVLKAAVEGRLVETEATLARREGRTYESGEQLLQAALVARRAKWDRRGQYVEPQATASSNLPRVPDGWVWANVEQLGFVRGGKRLPAGHKYADGPTPHPYIRVTDFADYGVNSDALLYLNPETQKEIQRYTITSDDVYISIAGSIGLVGVLPRSLSGANLTENAAKITGLGHISQKYLMYWLSSGSGIKFISDSTIATTQAKLALYRIERIPVPVPPLAEQTRIVAEVDRHLSIIREVEAEVDANLQRAQSLRQATLAKAIQGEKRD